MAKLFAAGLFIGIILKQVPGNLTRGHLFRLNRRNQPIWISHIQFCTVNRSVRPADKLHWFRTLSHSQRDSLKAYLTNLHDKYWTRPGDHKSKIIQYGVERILEKTVNDLAEQDKRFTCTIIPVGSFYHDMKIFDPDEFDFTLKLNSDMLGDLLGGSTRELLSGVANGMCLLKLFDRTVHFNETPSDDLRHVRKKLFRLIRTSLTDLDLPENWTHCGFNSPSFSGTRKNGPAEMLQFTYHDPETGSQEYVNVDIASVIPVTLTPGSIHARMSEDYSDPFTLFLLKNFPEEFRDSWLLLSSELKCRLVFTKAENEFLNLSYSESLGAKTMLVAKKAITICKILARKALLGERLTEQNRINISDEERRHIRSLPSGKLCFEAMQQFKRSSPDKDEDLVQRILKGHLAVKDMHQYNLLHPDNSFRSLGEFIGLPQLISSHSLKKIVLTMLALEYEQGYGWTEDDIPSIVVSTFHILVMLFDHYDDEVSDFQYIKQKSHPDLFENSFLLKKTIKILLDLEARSRSAEQTVDSPSVRHSSH